MVMKCYDLLDSFQNANWLMKIWIWLMKIWAQVSMTRRIQTLLRALLYVFLGGILLIQSNKTLGQIKLEVKTGTCICKKSGKCKLLFCKIWPSYLVHFFYTKLTHIIQTPPRHNADIHVLSEWYSFMQNEFNCGLQSYNLFSNQTVWPRAKYCMWKRQIIWIIGLYSGKHISMIWPRV